MPDSVKRAAPWWQGLPLVETTWENERIPFRPLHVVGLLVGEAPPASGNFFYRATGYLYSGVKASFSGTFRAVPGGGAFLHWFRSQGWYLVDLCTRPVNDEDRTLRCQDGEKLLAALIARARPNAVVACLKRIEGNVQRALAEAEYAPDHFTALAFPARHKNQFVAGLQALLKKSALDELVVGGAPILRVDNLPGYLPMDMARELIAHPELELYQGRLLYKLVSRREPATYERQVLSAEAAAKLMNGLVERGFFELPAHLSAELVTDAGTTRITAYWRGEFRAVECYAFDLAPAQGGNQQVLDPDVGRFSDCYHWVMSG